MSDQKEKFLIDTTQDENIYLLGLFWADGYVGKKYDIRLELKSTDFEYIKPLLKIYGFTKFGERRRYKNNKIFGNIQNRFCISNVSLNKQLQQLGYREKSIISPNKVLSLIPENKHYLFWRGFFDGDACFYCKGSSHTFTVWGSIGQDWSEVKSLLSKLNINDFGFKTYRRQNGKHCSSCISVRIQKDIEKLGNYIYKDKLNIGFKRKYKKYIECINPPTPLFEKVNSFKKGVYFSIWTGKWICRKTINHKRIIIGSFNNYNDACKAFDIF